MSVKGKIGTYTHQELLNIYLRYIFYLRLEDGLSNARKEIDKLFTDIDIVIENEIWRVIS